MHKYAAQLAKSAAVKQAHVAVNPLGPLNKERFTGEAILGKKFIRKDANGADNFEDYFSESSQSVYSIGDQSDGSEAKAKLRRKRIAAPEYSTWSHHDSSHSQASSNREEFGSNQASKGSDSDQGSSEVQKENESTLHPQHVATEPGEASGHCASTSSALLRHHSSPSPARIPAPQQLCVQEEPAEVCSLGRAADPSKYRVNLSSALKVLGIVEPELDSGSSDDTLSDVQASPQVTPIVASDVTARAPSSISSRAAAPTAVNDLGPCYSSVHVFEPKRVRSKRTRPVAESTRLSMAGLLMSDCLTPRGLLASKVKEELKGPLPQEPLLRGPPSSGNTIPGGSRQAQHVDERYTAAAAGVKAAGPTLASSLTRTTATVVAAAGLDATPRSRYVSSLSERRATRSLDPMLAYSEQARSDARHTHVQSCEPSASEAYKVALHKGSNEDHTASYRSSSSHLNRVESSVSPVSTDTLSEQRQASSETAASHPTEYVSKSLKRVSDRIRVQSSGNVTLPLHCPKEASLAADFAGEARQATLPEADKKMSRSTTQRSLRSARETNVSVPVRESIDMITGDGSPSRFRTLGEAARSRKASQSIEPITLSLASASMHQSGRRQLQARKRLLSAEPSGDISPVPVDRDSENEAVSSHLAGLSHKITNSAGTRGSCNDRSRLQKPAMSFPIPSEDDAVIGKAAKQRGSVASDTCSRFKSSSSLCAVAGSDQAESSAEGSQGTSIPGRPSCSPPSRPPGRAHVRLSHRPRSSTVVSFKEDAQPKKPGSTTSKGPQVTATPSRVSASSILERHRTKASGKRLSRKLYTPAGLPLEAGDSYTTPSALEGIENDGGIRGSPFANEGGTVSQSAEPGPSAAADITSFSRAFGRRRQKCARAESATTENLSSISSDLVYYHEVTATTPAPLRGGYQGPQKVVVPKVKPGEENLRRSKRIRVKPLLWYLNERIDYSPASGGFASIIPPISENDVGIWPVPKKKKIHGKKQKLTKVAESSLASVEVSNSQLEDEDEDITVVTPETCTERKEACLKRKRHFNYKGPSGSPDPSDPFQYCNPVLRPGLAVGQLRLKPNATKPPVTLHGNDLIFTVLKGMVELTIHYTTRTVKPSDVFIVPRGNSYCIRNLSADKEVILSYTKYGLDVSDANSVEEVSESTLQEPNL